MIKIEIDSDNIEVKHVTARRDGREYQIPEQNAFLHTPGQKYPTPFRLTLDKNQPAYRPGMYQLDLNSIGVDRFGSLTLFKVKLLPIPAASSAKSA